MGKLNKKLILNQKGISANFGQRMWASESLYSSALFGYSIKLVKTVNMLKDLGFKSGQSILLKNDYDKARKLVELEKNSDKKTYIIKITKKEFQVLKKAMLFYYREYKEIPNLAREQYIVSLVITFETFINDSIRNILTQIPDTLKSSKSSLSDEEIIGLTKPETMNLLIDKKMRDLTYGPINSGLDYLSKVLNIHTNYPNLLTELGRVRNCIVHNNGLVDKDLSKIGKKRYRIGIKIKISESELKHGKDLFKQLRDNIQSQIETKFRGSQARK
jgi:hypothetical protein